MRCINIHLISLLKHWLRTVDASSSTTPQSEDPNHTLKISRRRFIGLTGAATLVGLPTFRIIGSPELETINSQKGAYLSLVLGSESQALEEATLAQLSSQPDLLQQWVDLPIVSLEILRPEDLLSLRFEFINLTLRTVPRDHKFLFFYIKRKPNFLISRLDPLKPAYVIVHFPQQHIAEEAFFEADPQSVHCEELRPPPVKSRISGPSRLAFRVPDELPSIPYTLEALLDWSHYEPSLVSTALPTGETTTDRIHEPDKNETAIEFPYRLILSPNRRSGWAHAIDPISYAHSNANPGQQSNSGMPPSVEWVELWHTRLAVRGVGGKINEANRYYRTLRAVWTQDQRAGNTAPNPCEPKRKETIEDDEDFRMSLDSRDRYEIMRLSSDFRIQNFTPAPIAAERLMLTSLGAWADLQGAWKDRPGSTGLSVREWRHLAMMGRDGYVRVVYGGHLYPCGHRANLTQVTERKFQRRAEGAPITAYLRQRLYITVEEPIKLYGNSNLFDGEKSVDRRMPFQRIEITTLVTPNLDPPEVCPIPGIPPGKCAFWPCVADRKFEFHFPCDDLVGQRSETASAMIFVSDSVEAMPNRDAILNAVRMEYDRYQNELRNGGLDFNGQKVAYAPSKQPGDTTLETHAINFTSFIRPPSEDQVVRAHSATLSADSRSVPATPLDESLACTLPEAPKPAPWEPFLDRAKVKIQSIAQLTNPINEVAPVIMEWDDTYAKKGFDTNVGEVFGKLSDNLSISLPDSRSVSLVKPDFDISALSRRFGAIGGDVEKLKDGFFNSVKLLPFDPLDPSTFRAKILGVIPLARVLRDLASFDASTGGEKVPKISAHTIYGSNGLPEAIESSMQWSPELKDFNGGIVSFVRLSNASMSLQVILRTQLGGNATYDLLGEIRNFRIEILESIWVNFEHLSFAARSGEKAKVAVDIKSSTVPDEDGVVFKGGLEFIAKLQEQLSSSLFGENGPSIRISHKDILATIGFDLPDVTSGAFSLLNIRLSAGLYLPLDGNSPIRLRVAFGERDDPFLVAVTFLGGGGFLAISMGLDGMEALECALEFGGIVALSLGIAEGTGYILGGIYMVYDKQTGTTLTGFLRWGGSMEVLGLITVSVEFYMGLSYNNRTGEVSGEATVIVRIEIAFFSKEVRLTAHRTFAGSKQQSLRAAVASQTSLLSTNRFFRAVEPGAPPFKELMPESDWDTYCDAFAGD